jgi:hypothetical protein
MNGKVTGRFLTGVVGMALVVASLVVVAIRTLAEGRLHYNNYWGGRVFAPVVLLIVALIIAGGVVSFLRRHDPPVKLRGRAARKACQAEKTTFPIDEYKKW